MSQLTYVSKYHCENSVRNSGQIPNVTTRFNYRLAIQPISLSCRSGDEMCVLSENPQTRRENLCCVAGKPLCIFYD